MVTDDYLIIGAAGCVVVGLWLVHPSLAFIGLGGMLFYLGYIWRGKEDDSRKD